MLILTCPYCGAACDETDLHAGGEAHITRAEPGDDDRTMEAYLFERKNPKGIHFERWRHVYGCGKWFHAARCSVTNEVFGTYPAQTLEPPSELIEKIKSRRPGWSYEGKS